MKQTQTVICFSSKKKCNKNLIKSCLAKGASGNDFDGDGLANDCDPCFDAPDSGENHPNDLNGNFVNDLCEAKDSGKKLICLGTISIYGEDKKGICCTNKNLEEINNLDTAYKCTETNKKPLVS